MVNCVSGVGREIRVRGKTEGREEISNCAVAVRDVSCGFKWTGVMRC